MWSELIATISRNLIEISNSTSSTMIVGICGAQGSGKSTAAEALANKLESLGKSVAVLSLDDLYLSHGSRRRLAIEIHPLLATRGPPGTHDVALGERTLVQLGRRGRTALPRFDKAHDSAKALAEWPEVEGPVDVILFEGWCVGALPQTADQLAVPMNELERRGDPDGVWRQFVNDALADDYQKLFALIDQLILLAAPEFSVVTRWRRQQEHQLRARLLHEGLPLAMTMDDTEIDDFVQHYERLTRHILNEMPGRADLTIMLDAERNVAGCRHRQREGR